MIHENQLFDVPKIIDVCVIYGDANRTQLPASANSSNNDLPILHLGFHKTGKTHFRELKLQFESDLELRQQKSAGTQ